ncbi:GntR family transcriptional regulator [Sphingobacterium sp. SRCM116780]|uniref:GntR family transcriptional regulator n=1 Tax=Sphingobacterium sp. SRCM116780 TaxID=2907623 RepID=UPI001F3C57B1|nr:GntR family transcriptional regulator [Sphingobacterium sp. SRCM116780]UIR54820.1 GntR family transcriptional regulator [Sphingobacterium sp. SRCM116780]
MKIPKEENFTPLIDRIKRLEALNALSKHECIVQGVLDAIDANELEVHASLPSVNNMIQYLGYARETFAKAYRDLIAHGVVESKNRKGYFVVSNNTQMKQKVAVVLYAYDTFQDTLVSELRANLPEEVSVDLFFHHNNMETFEDIFNRIQGRYTVYIVAPIENKPSIQLLQSIPSSKLLIIDRLLDLGEEYSYVAQEFEKSTYQVFEQLYPKIKKYEDVIFYFREHTAEPNEIKNAFLKFLKKYKIKGHIEKQYHAGELQQGKLYFTIHNPELYQMLKEVLQKGWELGDDLGILSHNDDVIKEIISGGITTFSTSFSEIGKEAAKFVLDREFVKMIVPTTLADRNSV